jgi:hypothetical protein
MLLRGEQPFEAEVVLLLAKVVDGDEGVEDRDVRGIPSAAALSSRRRCFPTTLSAPGTRSSSAVSWPSPLDRCMSRFQAGISTVMS